MQASPVLSLSRSCPSFNSYSSSNFADIAARVVQELRMESSSEAESAIFDYWDAEYYRDEDDKNIAADEDKGEAEEVIKEEEEEEEEEEFEFAFVCREPDSSPISADEIFCNGQIRPIYPIFDTSLLINQNHTQQVQAEVLKLHTNNTNNSQNKASSITGTNTRRSPLKKLLSEDRETTASCSSSEADDLEGAEPGTFCVWTPRRAEETEEEQGKCKKSHSTGSSSSSKRWKFRDLLYNRSNSDGKDRFVFLKGDREREKGEEQAGKGKEHSHLKMKKNNNNRGATSVKNPRSFLPYRQELVGIFSNINGLNRNFHPFLFQ